MAIAEDLRDKPILEVAGLTVRFGGIVAVDDVSFDLKPGEILGIIGPNGAGKTTVFDAISGFVASTGKVVLDGNEIGDKSPERRARARLGRSFQDAKLFPSLTVNEALKISFERHIRVEGVVSTALSMPWVRRSEKRVAAKVEGLIELMGLGAFRDKFISELSTGSRRIVDLAAILAHEPLVLLLDEPSSGIAQRETEALGPLLLRIREQTGASLLVIEHDMPLITGISDEILALETGQVLTRGAPEEVLNDPRLVSAYLGTDRAVLERSGVRTGEPPKKKAPAKKQAASTKKVAAKKKAAPLKKKAVAKKAVAKKAPVKKTAAKAAGGSRPSRTRSPAK
jgi:branched-chain amino acid transport system ATP-binding protein